MAVQKISPGAIDRLRASLLGIVSAVVAFCVGDAFAHNYPFGKNTRSVNDLGNQFVPYHAHLWDLLHGKADGGLLLNWQSGYGTSFLPDLGTYVSSPFALLVAVFPRDRIDLAVYAITVLKIGAAAAAMACLLLTLRPGRWWAAGLLGASYAMCGWTVAAASYNTMWLDGLIAFPLFCMVVEWARTGRRPFLSIAVVALGWTANFYIAYMATIGSALVLIALLLMEPDATRRHWLTSIGRASRSMVLGIGLTAPLLLTIVKGTKLAYPGTVQEFRPVAWADVFGRLLPGTYNFATPAVYLDTAALLLAFVLPFHPEVPRRTRLVWTGLVLAVTVSMQLKPTHLAWHAFATPNGSAYRQTFVLSGVMIIAAWLGLAHGLPKLRQIAWGAAVMGVVALVAIGADKGVTGAGTYPLFGVGLVLAVGALLLLRRAELVRSRALVVAAVIGLLVVQIGQSAFTNAWSDRKRIEVLDDYAPWGNRQNSQAAAIASADNWPEYRTDPGREQTVGNDPMMVGGEGAAYYSSLTPDIWTYTLASLGGGWTSHGRSLQSLDSPVTDVIFSVGARSHQPLDPHEPGNPQVKVPSTITRQQVPPLVTVHPSKPAAGYGDSPYRNQELLLGHSVYDTPGPIVLHDGDGNRVLPENGRFHLIGGYANPKRSTYKLEATCPAGDQAYLYTPSVFSHVQVPGGPNIRFTGRLTSRRAAAEHVGDALADGHVSLSMRVLENSTFGTDAVGCLNMGKLAAAEQQIAATAATSEQVTDDGITAQLPPGSRGFAVVAAPAITGWQCSAGNGSARAGRSYLGLLSVPLPADGSATSVSCSFSPPGLHQGEAVAGVSLLGIVALGGYGWWRRRRSGDAVGDGGSGLGASPEPVSAAMAEG
ncbi:YfhO family protein [Streptomyces sp. NBC_00433]